MKKKKLLSVLVAAAMSCSLFAAVPVVSQAEGATGINMYRLYNPNSWEHFYTASETERYGLLKAGWSDEGIGWIAPDKSNTPVYRLYNANSGDHHYTVNVTERNNLISVGWTDEGIGWYSDGEKTIPVYREYNPYAETGTHNYTTNKAEHDSLVNVGWHDEGIGWYATGDEMWGGDNIVILGTYEQDNDLTNGPEPIEWQVIDSWDGHKFLLSEYALDCKLYNEERHKDITWEDCTLRSWLNNDFYNTAFSAYDRQRIVTSHNENPDSYELYRPWEAYNFPPGAKGGNATDDKVFLLSWTEARDYFDGKLHDFNIGAENYNSLLPCKPTAYAKAQGVFTYDSPDNPFNYPYDTDVCCEWWLRSPGVNQFGATTVSHMGALLTGNVCTGKIGVRPALLID